MLKDIQTIWNYPLLTDSAAQFLERFHAGEKAAIEQLYDEYFDTAMRAVGQVVSGADQETIVHDVFVKFLSKRETRESFTGGSIAAWLRAVCRNAAIDYVRRHKRECVLDPEIVTSMSDRVVESMQPALDANRLIEQFKQQVPEKWLGVFETRFLQQLSQREAADKLGMSRTTLAYQELQLRRRLRRFLLKGEL